MERDIVDVVKVIIGLYLSLVLLALVYRFGKKLPGGVGSFFAGAQKLATPTS